MDGLCGFGLVGLIQLVDPSAIPVRSTIPALVCYRPVLPFACIHICLSCGRVWILSACAQACGWQAGMQCLCLHGPSRHWKEHISHAAERVKPVHTKRYTSLQDHPSHLQVPLPARTHPSRQKSASLRIHSSLHRCLPMAIFPLSLSFAGEAECEDGAGRRQQRDACRKTHVGRPLQLDLSPSSNIPSTDIRCTSLRDDAHKS